MTDLHHIPAGDGAAPEVVLCEHAVRCAGCPLIDRPYPEQLALKQDRLAAAIAPYPRLQETTVEPMTPASPRSAYRTRAKLMVGSEPSSDGTTTDEGSAARVTLGLFGRAPEPHRVIDIPACRVLTPALAEVSARLRELLRAPPSAAGACLKPEASGGLLSAVDLREVRDERAGVMVTLVLAGDIDGREAELASAASAVREASPLVAGIAVNQRDERSPQVLGPKSRVVSGPPSFRDRGESAYHLAAYGSFVQAHRGQAAHIEQLLARHLDALGAPSSLRVLDLYGGSGALSLPVARRGAEVVLVESFRPAAECAERAAREQRIGRFAVRAGDAGDVMRALVAEGRRFDALLMNPPRRGVAPYVRAAAAKMRPRLIVYVSCDPDTLSRDLDHLAALGYRTAALHPIDMIPLTDQVETVALLTPAPAAPPRALYEDDDVRVVEKSAHAAPDGGAGVEARPVWSVSPDASGVAVFARGAGGTERLRVVLGAKEARHVHYALARGVTSAKGSIKGRTRYRRVQVLGGHSLLYVMGPANERALIESDLARIGHPVVGDRRRGHAPTNRHFEEKHALDRPFLHCAELSFAHPRGGATITTACALPPDLRAVLARLGSLRLDADKRLVLGSDQ